jgi:hypothetical protein
VSGPGNRKAHPTHPVFSTHMRTDKVDGRIIISHMRVHAGVHTHARTRMHTGCARHTSKRAITGVMIDESPPTHAPPPPPQPHHTHTHHHYPPRSITAG